MDYRLGPFYASLRAFARLDVDALQFHVGLEFYPYNWNRTLPIREVDEEQMTGLKIELPFGRYELKVSYQLLRQDTALFFSLQAALCESHEDCLPSLHVLKDVLLPVPNRLANGTVVFPDMDLAQILSMKSVVKAAKKAAAANLDKALNLIEKELGLPEVCDR